MRYSLIAAGMAASVMAAPAKLSARTTSSNIDPTILNFALTLEHLENTFYKQAISKFSASDFAAAGYDSTYYNNLKYISFDEQSHVSALSAALTAAGVTPVQPCTYNFPYTDVKSFITLSSVLEGVGTSAYLGAAPLVTDKGYLTVAGSILVTEALHTSYQRAAIKEVPFANPYGTPIDPTSAYTLAAQFIVSCPPSNPDLGFKAFPALTLSSYSGYTAKFTTKGSCPEGSYLTFVSGLAVVSVPATVNGYSVSANVPSQASGQTYVYLTKGDSSGSLKDASVLAGPAIIEVAPAAPY